MEKYDLNLLDNVYILKHKNEDIRLKSSSGGAFSAIVECMSIKKGHIFASKYDKNMKLINTKLESQEDLMMMRGSKYVQGSTHEAYRKIIDMLKMGENVLYIGTPCQVDALNSICNLKKISTKNLILVDLICHGFQSPIIEKEFFSIIKKDFNLKDFKYRTKEKGWHTMKPMAFSENNEKKSLTKWLEYSLLLLLFGNYYTYRDSCTECPYCFRERYSDMTIGDAWGIEKMNPSLDDDKGLSLVIANSDKGYALLKDCEKFCEIIKCEYEKLKQPRISGIPTPKPKNKDFFWKYYHEKGFVPTIKKYASYGIKGRIMYYIKFVLRKIGITKIIKGLMC